MESTSQFEWLCGRCESKMFDKQTCGNYECTETIIFETYSLFMDSEQRIMLFLFLKAVNIRRLVSGSVSFQWVAVGLGLRVCPVGPATSRMHDVWSADNCFCRRERRSFDADCCRPNGSDVVDCCFLNWNDRVHDISKRLHREKYSTIASSQQTILFNEETWNGSTNVSRWLKNTLRLWGRNYDGNK